MHTKTGIVHTDLHLNNMTLLRAAPGYNIEVKGGKPLTEEQEKYLDDDIKAELLGGAKFTYYPKNIKILVLHTYWETWENMIHLYFHIMVIIYV